jgi:hypothetical protein
LLGGQLESIKAGARKIPVVVRRDLNESQLMIHGLGGCHARQYLGGTGVGRRRILFRDVFRPFGGFADDTPVAESYVTMPDIPGVGFEANANLHKVMKPFAS